MSVKILGGLAKGLGIEVPNNQNVRPTSVMLRRKVFDSFQDLGGFHFYDICAGSGAMGFEASSRGASRVFFFEKDKKAIQILSQNIERFQQLDSIESELKLIKGEFQKTFDCSSVVENSILFFDPPYQNKKYYEIFAQQISGLNASHQIWIESDRQKGFSIEDIQAIFGEASKVFIQGTSFILIINNLIS